MKMVRTNSKQAVSITICNINKEDEGLSFLGRRIVSTSEVTDKDYKEKEGSTSFSDAETSVKKQAIKNKYQAQNV